MYCAHDKCKDNQHNINLSESIFNHFKKNKKQNGTIYSLVSHADDELLMHRDLQRLNAMNQHNEASVKLHQTNVHSLYQNRLLNVPTCNLQNWKVHKFKLFDSLSGDHEQVLCQGRDEFDAEEKHNINGWVFHIIVLSISN